MKKLIIFDFDGTLVHTAPLTMEIINKFRGQMNMQPIKLDDIEPWIGSAGNQLIKNYLCTRGDATSRWLKKFRERYNKIKTPKKLIYKWVEYFVPFALSKPFLLGVCSNKPQKLLIQSLKQTDLERFFPIIVGGSISSKPKLHPDRLFTCLDFYRLNAKEAIMIGDSKTDQEACSNAKVDFIFFENGYNDGVDIGRLKYSFSTFEQLQKILAKIG